MLLPIVGLVVFWVWPLHAAIRVHAGLVAVSVWLDGVHGLTLRARKQQGTG